MSHIYVPFDSIGELVEKFRDINIIQHATHINSNFVLVNPDLYFGSYGGLIYNSLLNHYWEDCYSESISDGLSIVWWKSPTPVIVGDRYVLSLGDRVAVTPAIFKQMLPSTFRKKTSKSSYYR